MGRAMAKTEKLISAILLGAGESKRMGKDKLRLSWGKSTVFGHCLKTLLQSELGEVVVVVRSLSEQFEDGIDRYRTFKEKKIKIVVNPDYQRGMSSSIVRGLKYLHPRSRGVLIVLGDQPLLKTRTINALIHAFVRRQGKIAVPYYHGRRGTPILFDRDYVKDLMKLTGDTGGRRIIETHVDKVVRVRTRSEAVVRDIDTREEYERQKAVGSRKKGQGKGVAQWAREKRLQRGIR